MIDNWVLFAGREWNSPWWTNPQIISTVLSKVPVYYVEYPKKAFQKNRHASNSIVPDRIQIVKPNLYLPLRVKGKVADNLLNAVGNYFIRQELRNFNLNTDSLGIWCISPHMWETFYSFKAGVKVLHITDFLWQMNYNNRQKSYLKNNLRKVSVKSTITVASSITVQNELMEMGIKNTYLMENSAIIDQYINIPFKPIPSEKLTYGFVGAIDDDKIDLRIFDLLLKKENKLIIVGDSVSGHHDLLNRFQSFRNGKVKILNSLTGKDLAKVFEQCDILVIPYKINGYTRGVLPLKLSEYLASGKPVITSDLPGLGSYSTQVFIAKTEQEWIAHSEKLVKRSLKDAENQKKWMLSNNIKIKIYNLLKKLA